MKNVILFGLFIVLALEASAMSDPRTFPRRTAFDNRAYVSLRHMARFYGFPRPEPKERGVVMGNERVQVLFQENSRRAEVNGVVVWLHEPVVVRRRTWLISETDARLVIDPVLRPAAHLSERGYRVIVLDPGHGGRDEGGRGVFGTREKDLALTIARRVAVLLARAGQRVYLTRDEDRYLSLEERVRFARDREADLFVSIHFNTSANRDAQGTETFVLTVGGHPSTNEEGGGSYPSDLPGNAFDGASMGLGYSIQKGILTATGNADRGVRRSRFYVVREAVSPAVLVECAFLTNPQEARKLQEVDYQNMLTEGIARGILEYLGATLRAQLQEAF